MASERSKYGELETFDFEFCDKCGAIWWYLYDGTMIGCPVCEVEEVRNQLDYMEYELEDQKSEVSELQHRIYDLESDLDITKDEVYNKDVEIRQLEDRIYDLEVELESN